MNRKILILSLCFVAVSSSVAATITKGSCQGAAASLGATQTVKLVAEYDGDSEVYDAGTPVYYFKMTAKRSNSYTIWTEGLSADSGVTLTAEARETTEREDEKDISSPSAEFSDVDEKPGNTRLVMYASDWYVDYEVPEYSDPPSWEYYVKLEGTNVGQTVTVRFQNGVVIPSGREENPKSISPSSTTNSVTTSLELHGEYYFKCNLTAGRLYSFSTSGGTAEHPLMMTIDGVIDEESGEVTSGELYVDSAVDGNNEGYFFIPSETGYYTIIVSGDDIEESPLSFTLNYLQRAKRDLGKHEISGDLTDGSSITVTPGYKNDPANSAYDEIIDQALYRFTAEKGAQYVVDVSEAATNLLLRIYDKNGAIVAENVSNGVGSFNVTAGTKATYNGLYYVGLCQNLNNEFVETPAYVPVTLRFAKVDAAEGEAVALSPLPGTKDTKPAELDIEGVECEAFGVSAWSKVFSVAARKNLYYKFAVTSEESPLNRLKAQVFYLSGTAEKPVSAKGELNAGAAQTLEFMATANQTYYVRVTVDGGTSYPHDGAGLSYPAFKMHSSAYTTDAAQLGILTVNIHGTTDGKWSLGSESTKYDSGSVLVSGTQTIKFSSVTGFTAPDAQKVTVAPGTEPTVVDAYYRDKFDDKDDQVSGATSWSLKNTVTTMSRTLWSGDLEDNFTFTTKDGYYYDFSLEQRDGSDAVFKIWNADGTVLVEDETEVKQLIVPVKKTKWYLTVSHGSEEKAGGSYLLSGLFANVGAIKFAKTTLTAKKNAGSVTVAVNRTAKDGRVRVKYGTVAGTAKPGERYVAQSGILEWADNNNKATNITIRLIPELVPLYTGENLQFKIQIKPLDGDELEPDEYPAAIDEGAGICTVTLTDANTTKTQTTEEEYYAKKAAVKAATVKTENVPLRTGTFYGVLAEDGCALTNGLPQLASVTLTTTAKAGKPDTLSAKVALAGKTYNFKTNTRSPEEWEDLDDGNKQIALSLVQTVNKVVYTNTLTLVVKDGLTTNGTDWVSAGGTAELVMNVPDANNKGAQEEIRYVGDIYRQNAKIQDYLNVVTNFFGYYTVALASEGVSSMDGIPAGNGYLTVKVDNKGTATVAGLLADNTRVSLSVTAAGICKDESSPLGYAMYLPIYLAKSPYCFGGTLRLYAKEGKTLPNKDYEIVVDSTTALIWNNDNAKLTYYNEDGWRILCDPVGGWYDTVMNLQAYYLNYAFEVGGADITEFPTELVASGYQVITDVQPNGEPVSLVNDAFSTAKKVLVKDGTLYDLVNSVNPCNVQVKLARATGLVTGSFSIWSEDEDGLKQKEITGFKHNGVLLLCRDEFSPISEDVLSVGFSLKTGVKLTDENPDTGKKTTRSWNLSLPFNLLGVDQGDVDWWADDWGWNPEWGEEPEE